MSDDEPLSTEQILDMVLYAPVGAVLEFIDRWPEFAAKGRERLGPQAPAARMIGEFAVTTGRRKLEELFDTARERSSASDDPEPDSEAREPDASEPSDAGEPFSGYDGLTAAEIISQLGSLDAVERDAVRLHEMAGRGRRTILGKLDQLDSRDG